MLNSHIVITRNNRLVNIVIMADRSLSTVLGFLVSFPTDRIGFTSIDITAVTLITKNTDNGACTPYSIATVGGLTELGQDIGNLLC